MPVRPARACWHYPCGNTMPCPEHPINVHRGANTRIYTSWQWRMFRARVLAEEPVCAACGWGEATDVDHINPIRANPTYEEVFDRTNVQGLCHSCHSKKTQRQRNARVGEG